MSSAAHDGGAWAVVQDTAAETQAGGRGAPAATPAAATKSSPRHAIVTGRE
jgi:hypothetical protein